MQVILNIANENIMLFQTPIVYITTDKGYTADNPVKHFNFYESSRSERLFRTIFNHKKTINCATPTGYPQILGVSLCMSIDK